ncbi:ABC transporter permease [Nocardioides okcheonensis]|uniref:ABC transporter permease n=1 Tax=Nocardioides okcheonensis TaxID=2894081 RepID=UPI001E397EE2|nr:ABC transporter permease subunit [Nocardioides okcheonensis]UFN46195.1 ABC transporter permease subunit [Nocardioides okcheonensis]
MTPSRTFRAVRTVLLLAFAAYFFVPLLAMLDFSTQARGSAEGRTWDNWQFMVTDEDLRSSIIASLLLALFTVVLMVVLLVPTMVWVRLRVPRARGLVEFLCLLPLTIPALVIVVGISNVYSWVTYLLGDSPLVLTFAYVVLVLPYSYRAIDAALSAIDVATLSEAARSLGAGWPTVIVRIVLPNITGGVLGAAFISVALVMGEYVFASLLHFDTLPVAMAGIYRSNPAAAMAAALASMLFVALLLVGLTFLSRDRHRHDQGASR